LSTTSVYGSQAEVVDETCQELDPQSPYADSKLRSELLLAELSRTSELKHITLRFGTIFGTSAGMRFHTAVNKFIWQAALGQPVTVWTTALDQRRPYLELGDAIRALCFVISNELFDGLTYNIVTFNATVRELLDTITAFVPDLEIKFVDTKIMNQLSYTVLSDKFCRRGFEFRGNLLSGVSESLGLLYQLRQAVRNSFEAKHAVEELRKLALPNWINVESEKPSTEERL
jgi:nucleoside-diphosphate-sugar epimerase